MGAPVEQKDIDGVVDAWKLHNTPYFSIWQGSNLKFGQEDTEELSEAEDMLRQNLEAIQASNTMAVYTLKSHRDSKNFSNKKDYKGSFNFRLSEYQTMQPNGTNGSGIIVLDRGKQQQHSTHTEPQLTTTLEAKLDRLIELQTLSMQEDGIDDDDDEQEEDPHEKAVRTAQMIGEVATQVAPVIQNLIQGIAGLFGFNNNNFNNQNFNSMSGTNTANSTLTPQQKIDFAMAELERVIGAEDLADALYKLGMMAQTNPNKLKGLIFML